MSRYPTFDGPAGGYDKSLLRGAPQITKADRQQGYSVDILEQGGPSNYNRSQFDPNVPRRQQFAGGYEQARSQRQEPNPFYPYDRPAPPSLDNADYYTPQTSLEQGDIFTINPYKPRKPWYRTTRGLVILFIVLLLLIGGAIGIAFGVRAATNKANADKKGAQEGQNSTSGGVAPTSVQRGSEAENTDGDNGLPELTTGSFVRLDPTSQATAPASSPTNLVISLNISPAPAASAIVQTRPAVPIQTRGTRPTSRPTPSVDPACERFPFLAACRPR